MTEATRRLVLLRHAKAEWSDNDDHERPLAERGRKEAPVAGQWLAGSGALNRGTSRSASVGRTFLGK
ncbi:hypothetical protein ABZ631_24980 [Nocardiopsis alba]|uniref:SixA phosphatase family protein n=1 Tax=Nocardiopsis alba TaxID=53437 RepID=UPI0033DFE33C